MSDAPTHDTAPQRSSDRWGRGLDAYASQFQIPRAEVAEWFTKTVGDRFGEEATYSAARAWTNDELSLRDRSLVVLASLITMGGADGQLRMQTRWAVDHGCTRDEIEAMAALLAIYAGFTRAANGLMVIREELTKVDSRQANNGVETQTPPGVPRRVGPAPTAALGATDGVIGLRGDSQTAADRRPEVSRVLSMSTLLELVVPRE